MSLEIKNGKFYRDGLVEPIQFGNRDQIKLMQQHLKDYEELIGDGVLIDYEIEEITTYKATMDYKCSCGKYVSFREEDLDDENDTPDFVGESASCRCGRKYEIAKNEDKDLVIKLIKEPKNKTK